MPSNCARSIARFGNEAAILKFMEIDPVLSRHPPELREAVAKHVPNTPGREDALIKQTQGWLTEPEMVGVLCLTEHPNSVQMWESYAQGSQGFVLAFDTSHPAFRRLRNPGRLGKVEYSDEPIPDFLTTYGVHVFFQKRTRYKFEGEWRSIRRFNRFEPENILRPKGALPIYLAPFDPACITAILIKPECAVEYELRTLAAVDARYRHVPLKLAP